MIEFLEFFLYCFRSIIQLFDYVMLEPHLSYLDFIIFTVIAFMLIKIIVNQIKGD